MSTIGIGQLRRHAAALVRRAEAGETITVTVSGHPVAALGPVRRNRWRSGAEIAAVFRGPADDDWVADRDALDSTGLDPFDR